MSNSNDEQKQQRRIVEESPMMRSVAMMSSSPSIPLRGTPSLYKQQPMLQTVPAAVEKAVIVVSSVNSNGSSISSSNTSSPWKVGTPLPLPSYYPLERTHVSVPETSSLDVSQRIADCLWKSSIAAVFDNEQALAKAETVECLKFAVRLWEVKGQVVAEVQRTSGCGFLYQQTAKRILRAAKYGIEEEDNSATKTTKNNPRSLPSCVPRVTPSQWEACTLDELSMAIKALQPGNKYDAHLLAMQSLVQLTEASQCRQYCVNIIFSKDSELLSTILTLVQSTSRLAADDNTATMNDYESGNSLVQEYCTVMHRHALTVLANCLAAVAEEDASVSTTNDVMEDLTSEATLSSLVRAVTQANAAPHAAASACRCLHSLCTLHPAIAPSLAQDFGMTETLVATQQECRHAILQTECAALMRDL